MELDPANLSRTERYKLVTGTVTPRPIAFVSSRSPEGHDNLAPFSFFNAAGTNPISFVFCVGSHPDGRQKDTLRNVSPKGEGGLGCFVINLAVEAYARQMAAAAENLPPHESELELAGFTPGVSKKIAAPRVTESPVSFECETTHLIQMGDEATGSTLVIGRCVYIWIRADLLDERMRVDNAGLATIGRMAGNFYCRTNELFGIPRGTAALEQDPPFPQDVGAASARGSEAD